MKKLICVGAMLFALPCFAHITYDGINDGKMHVLSCKSPYRPNIIVGAESDDGEAIPPIICNCYDRKTGKLRPIVEWSIFINNEYRYWYASTAESFSTSEIHLPPTVKVTRIVISALLRYPEEDAMVNFRT